MRPWCLAALLGLCVAAPVWADAPDPGPAHLVADLNPALNPLGPDLFSAFRSYTPLGGRVLFLSFLFATDNQCGLWSTDGTAAGTGRLADLCAESLRAESESIQVRILGAAGPLVFLTDSLGRLWRTDGTAAGAGTFSLGVTVSTNSAQPVAGPQGILYFASCDAAGDCQPWRSDGTLAGTRQLRAIENDPHFSATFRFAVQGDHVLFSGSDVQSPVLWITNGAEDGTRELARLPDRIGYFLEVDGGVYVSTNTGDFSSDLWLVPAGGSPNVRLHSFPIDFRYPGVFLFRAGGRVLFQAFEEDGVVSLWEIPALRQVRFLARFGAGMGPISEAGGRLIFAAAADYSAERFSLWVMGPRMGRPRPVHGCPGGCPSVEPIRSQLGVLADRTVFAGRDHRGSELWETDGTGAGTKLVKDLCPGKCGSLPHGFSSGPGRLIFTAGDRELWSTDGTAAGTARLGRIFPGFQEELDFAALEGRVVFSGFDSVAGDQPWVSDLTAAGTHRIDRLGGGLAAGSAIQSLTPLGSGALFGACTLPGPALWHSDGTAAGTQRLVDAGQDCSTFLTGPIVTAGGAAFFSLDSAHLWRTDGTPEGTQILASWSDPTLDGLLPLNGGVFFFTGQPQPPFGVDFWRSDGTPQGTRLTGSVPMGGPTVVGAAGNDVFFVAQQGIPPFDDFLWRTDGTAAGTRALASPAPGEFGPSDLVQIEGRTLFVMAGAGRNEGSELWTTDGTAAGTVPVIADPNAPRPLHPRRLAVLQGAAYFFADTGDPGRPSSLWRSDGTEAGTSLVVDFAPASDPLASFTPALTLAGGFLFFPWDDGVHGQELWRTDGTAAGTVLVRDVAPGPAHGRPESLTAAGGRLYFTATDGEHGLELWTSDGTAEGTAMVQDVVPGPVSSWPQSLAAADGNLFFTACDGEHGRELWVLPLAP